MPIFSRTNTKQIEKASVFIGAYLDPDLLSYFAAYVLSSGMTKTDLLQSILESWKDSKIEQGSTDLELAANLAKTALGACEELNDAFTQSVRLELLNKGLTDTIVALTIVKLNETYKTTQEGTSEGTSEGTASKEDETISGTD